jgi:hypothetical protein
MDGTLVRIFDADCLEEVNIVNRAPEKCFLNMPTAS